MVVTFKHAELEEESLRSSDVTGGILKAATISSRSPTSQLSAKILFSDPKIGDELDGLLGVIALRAGGRIARSFLPLGENGSKSRFLNVTVDLGFSSVVVAFFVFGVFGSCLSNSSKGTRSS